MTGTVACAHCGQRTPNPYRLCDPCRTAGTTAERSAQGLGPGIEDRGVLHDIDSLLLSARRAKRRRPRAA